MTVNPAATIIGAGGGARMGVNPNVVDPSNQYLMQLYGYTAGLPQLARMQAGTMPVVAGGAQRTYQGVVQPTLMEAFRDWLPLLTGATTEANRAVRTANVADVARLGPAAMAGVRALNPEQTALIDQILGRAGRDLDLGATLDPETIRNIRNATIGEASSRGWGFNPGDMARVGMQTGAAGQALLQQRQGAATSAAGLGQLLTGPAWSLLGGTSTAPATALGTGLSGWNLAAGSQLNQGPALDIWNTVLNQMQSAENARASNVMAGLGGAVGSSS